MIEKTVRANGSLRIRQINSEKSMTDQSFKDDCDINNIMRKYDGRMSMVPSLQRGVYADLSEVTDYREMVETVMRADEAFMTLPAELRKRFGNDPAELIAFLGDEKNYDEALKYGLVNKREIVEPSPTNAIQREQVKATTKNAKVPKTHESLDE